MANHKNITDVNTCGFHHLDYILHDPLIDSKEI